MGPLGMEWYVPPILHPEFTGVLSYHSTFAFLKSFHLLDAASSLSNLRLVLARFAPDPIHMLVSRRQRATYLST